MCYNIIYDSFLVKDFFVKRTFSINENILHSAFVSRKERPFLYRRRKFSKKKICINLFFPYDKLNRNSVFGRNMFVRQSISDLTFNIAQVNERKGLLSFEKIKLCHTLNPFKVFQTLTSFTLTFFKIFDWPAFIIHEIQYRTFTCLTKISSKFILISVIWSWKWNFSLNNAVDGRSCHLKFIYFLKIWWRNALKWL